MYDTLIMCALRFIYLFIHSKWTIFLILQPLPLSLSVYIRIYWFVLSERYTIRMQCVFNVNVSNSRYFLYGWLIVWKCLVHLLILIYFLVNFSPVVFQTQCALTIKLLSTAIRISHTRVFSIKFCCKINGEMKNL